MRIQFYKPTPAMKGLAASFKLDDKGFLMFEAIRQATWNAEKRTGSFKANAKDQDKKAIIKFSQLEAAGLILAIDKVKEFSFFHTSEAGATKGSLKASKFTDGRGVEQERYMLSVNDSKKSDPQFSLSLTPEEAFLLKSFLTLFINQSFDVPTLVIETPVQV